MILNTLRKRKMKELITDSCTKTVFSFNNKIYNQIDGVSIRSRLDPVVANIIMTELEKIIAKDLADKSLIKVYMRYVDDTILLVKQKDNKIIYERLNFFDKNIEFTIDSFADRNIQFLDIQIKKNLTSIYYKLRHSVQ